MHVYRVSNVSIFTKKVHRTLLVVILLSDKNLNIILNQLLFILMVYNAIQDRYFSLSR
jgi:hypothetical protein